MSLYMQGLRSVWLGDEILSATPLFHSLWTARQAASGSIGSNCVKLSSQPVESIPPPLELTSIHMVSPSVSPKSMSYIDDRPQSTESTGSSYT